MSNIDTISEFLLHAGTDYRIYDMARGIRPVSSQTFLDIENGLVPAPLPRQQHAWFGILFFNKQASKEQYIWFVKLPLDEKGLVIPAGRQQFLQIVVEALGQYLENENNPNNQLPENPFTFVPNQNQLADFNSICRTSLELPPSAHFEQFKNYLEQPKEHDWKNLAIQGVADFCATISTSDSTELLINTFNDLAPEIQNALCSSLENHEVNSKLCMQLIDWQQEKTNDLQRLAATLRGLCQGVDKPAITSFLHQVLTSSQSEKLDILILIAARHWSYLNDQSILKMFIQRLADSGSDTFVSLYSDLVQIPEIRVSMLSILRWPDKSPQLTQAIGLLFGQESA
ncbi:DUF3549 family protein [Paraglaciecola aquimarina]|uniref:DUF3549 family protein n=1 Tax=Paraglaciecola aquimarina TaxID=1235557 RepID=A0ABU3T1E5_9ALTE|nr:DUF3549 family protein [Paraglaciecola aquimarina]MDU0356089.1 DUF3549 family protein [Paraglaciecola aquimarina]